VTVVNHQISTIVGVSRTLWYVTVQLDLHDFCCTVMLLGRLWEKVSGLKMNHVTNSAGVLHDLEEHSTQSLRESGGG